VWAVAERCDRRAAGAGAQQQTRRTPLLLSIDGTDRQTHGRTDRYIESAARAAWAASINKDKITGKRACENESNESSDGLGILTGNILTPRVPRTVYRYTSEHIRFFYFPVFLFSTF